tara:strand:+ start:32 stop:652 length:621 start_codon:yes stop_codon:yes gene_type:complete
VYIVGLTGGIGCGKSEASKLFTKLLVPVIDLDDIAHEITRKNQLGYVGIKEKYGDKYFNKKEELLREKLKKDFFNSKNTKKIIENILHPIIFNECKKQIKKFKSEQTLKNLNSSKYIVIVIPLLFESKNYLKLINESLLIDCDEKIQIKRVANRDKLDKKLIQSIINSQISRDEKIKKADKIIDNNFSKKLLKDKIYKFHSDLINR